MSNKARAEAVWFQDLSHMKGLDSNGSLYAKDLSLFRYLLNIFRVII